MQKTKALLTALTLISMTFGPTLLAHAQELAAAPTAPTLEASTIVSEEIEEVDPVILLTQELAALKAKFQDPNTGRFARFFLRIKINELTNQLNIQKALQQD